MRVRISTFPALAAVGVLAALAGCATQPDGPPGKHLVYRDSSGAVVRQFDYPDDAFCRRVEAAAGRSARCQPEPASGFGAQATLRYNPPGVVVPAHYADMRRCQTDTGTLAGGVELLAPCRAK